MRALNYRRAYIEHVPLARRRLDGDIFEAIRYVGDINMFKTITSVQ